MITTPRLHHFARLTFTGLVTASLTLAVATTPAVFADDIAITPVPGDGAGQHWPRWRGPSG